MMYVAGSQQNSDSQNVTRRVKDFMIFYFNK